MAISRPSSGRLSSEGHGVSLDSPIGTCRPPHWAAYGQDRAHEDKLVSASVTKCRCLPPCSAINGRILKGQAATFAVAAAS